MVVEERIIDFQVTFQRKFSPHLCVIKARMLAI